MASPVPLVWTYYSMKTAGQRIFSTFTCSQSINRTLTRALVTGRPKYDVIFPYETTSRIRQSIDTKYVDDVVSFRPLIMANNSTSIHVSKVHAWFALCGDLEGFLSTTPT